MKKWLFSNNEKVVGPIAGAEAVKYVKDNPGAYVWQPEYGLWQPAITIDELNDEVSVPVPPATLNAADVENFHSKEAQLLETFERIDVTFRVSANSLKEINEEIDTHHAMTMSLIKEVKQAIKTIENQHKALQRNLADVANRDIAMMVGEK